MLEELKERLRRLGLRGALEVEERDPQYKALRYLYKRKGWEALPLVVGNALVSYQLPMRGEEYWWAFARSAGEGTALEEFVGRHNRRLLPAKLKRLKRGRVVWERVERDWGLEELYRRLRALYGRQKTVSFAVKMAGYFKRAAGEEVVFPFSIPLPYDSRIARLSKALGVGRAFWDELAEEVGIPPLPWTASCGMPWPLKGAPLWRTC